MLNHKDLREMERRMIAVMSATLKTRVDGGGTRGVYMSEQSITEKVRYTEDGKVETAPSGAIVKMSVYDDDGDLIEEFSAMIPAPLLAFNGKDEESGHDLYSVLLTFNDTHYNLDIYFDEERPVFADVIITREDRYEDYRIEYGENKSGYGDLLDSIGRDKEVYQDSDDEGTIFAFVGRMKRNERDIEFISIGKTTAEEMLGLRDKLAGDKEYYGPVWQGFDNELDCYTNLKNEISTQVLRGMNVTYKKSLE